MELCQNIKNALPAEILERLWPRGCVQLATVTIRQNTPTVHPVGNLDMSFQRKAYVELVMSENVSVTDLKKRIEDEIIKNDIVKGQNFVFKKDSATQQDGRTLITSTKPKETLSLEILRSMDYQKTNITVYWSADAKFAEAKKDHILTTVTLLENLEVCFVVNATKVSDSYKMTLKLLEVFFNTSIEISEISKLESGENN